MPTKKRIAKRFHCYWCLQQDKPPIRGRDRLNRVIMICPDCRGPV